QRGHQRRRLLTRPRLARASVTGFPDDVRRAGAGGFTGPADSSAANFHVGFSMRKLVRAAVLVTGAALAGCSSDPPAPPVGVTRGPHQGTTIRLPEDKGFVELVNEPEVDGRGRNEATALVAYFLNSDGKSPLSPAPTGVKFELAVAGKKAAQPVALAPEPKADDPAGAARFASKTGPYNLAEVR